MRPDSWTEAPRRSAGMYLSALLVGSVLSLWAGYLWPGVPVFKGQSPALLVGLGSIALALVLWFALDSRNPTTGAVTFFLAMLGLTWVAFLTAFRIHGDAFTYAAFGLPAILVMLWRKPPSVIEGMQAIRSLAWAVSFVIIATLLLEFTGVLAQKYQHWQIIRFDEDYYWLPLNDLLGIEGRWPGPFGHNGYTAMMGAFLILIAVSFWSRGSLVFIAVGALTLSVTAGRASVGAALAGMVIVAMLTPSKPLSRIPQPVRVAIGGVLLAGGLLALLSGRAGLTGRQDIWPAFLDLWTTSPWTGVGSEAIRSSDGIVGQYGHAHSLYLDVLTRYGLVALIILVATLAVGVWITARAGLKGLPGPLAIVAGYLVICITEPRNDWLHPGTLVLMVITSVMIAGATLNSSGDRLPKTSEDPHGERLTRDLT